MKRVVTIEYNWAMDSDSKAEIKEKHQEALEEKAMERVVDMISEGYTSGELCDNVRMDDEDGENGIAYGGWWSITTKTL